MSPHSAGHGTTRSIASRKLRSVRLASGCRRGDENRVTAVAFANYSDPARDSSRPEKEPPPRSGFGNVPRLEDVVT